MSKDGRKSFSAIVTAYNESPSLPSLSVLPLFHFSVFIFPSFLRSQTKQNKSHKKKEYFQGKVSNYEKREEKFFLSQRTTISCLWGRKRELSARTLLHRKRTRDFPHWIELNLLTGITSSWWRSSDCCNSHCCWVAELKTHYNWHPLCRRSYSSNNNCPRCYYMLAAAEVVRRRWIVSAGAARSSSNSMFLRPALESPFSPTSRRLMWQTTPARAC